MKPLGDDDRATIGRVSPRATGAEAGGDPIERLGADVPPEEIGLREMGYAMVDLIVEYMSGLESRRVYGPLTPLGLDDTFAEPLPEEGVAFADLVQDCRARVFPNTWPSAANAISA